MSKSKRRRSPLPACRKHPFLTAGKADHQRSQCEAHFGSNF
jgi:hypothetical protein